MSGYALGVDVGNRRVGVASASLIARLPSPLVTIDRKDNDAVTEIVRLVGSEGAEVVVVGLPRDMNGRETEQTLISKEFASQLSDKLEIPVVMQDEAGTSIEAESRLKLRGVNFSKGDVDSEAAAIILDDYLKTQVRRTS